ncbi:hypothetical protein X797_008780 [Metarhizium robertsii]|uniref:Uncharacterized protein n=1 Tax=Metarhizium robertsii TaxID=568076 RepID=A0A0A1URJ4_9HYPO|nr:hypothetical protein X797_008780 [Metarhizium robertsii]
MQVFDLPASFLTALNAGLAIYADTVPASRTEDVSTCEKYVIQQNGAYSAFSIAMNHNVKTLKTRVLILGVESSTLLDLFEYVESMLPRIQGPMLIPTIAMELQAHSLSMTIKNCRRHIHTIETTTGMRQFNYPHEKRGDNALDWKSLDLISITRELSSFLARFAFIKMQAETGRHLVQQMIRSTNLLVVDNGQQELVYKLQHIDNWFLGVAANCGYLSERATAQSQTDSSTNIEIAQSSREIAEQSHKENGAMRSLAELGRQDNELMIQIARDSRAVALAAAQDSAAMQVIAAVTMLFLPATFTATRRNHGCPHGPGSGLGSHV